MYKMDTEGWILLIVVVACVIALIILTKKRRDLEKSMSYGTDFDSDFTTNKPVVEEKAEEQGPPQVTIYEYRAANKKRLCALCDGENDPSATHCQVCGQQLN